MQQTGLSYHGISHYVILCHIMSYHIVDWSIISYRTVSYHIGDWSIISYCVTSYSRLVYHIISYHIITYHFISYHIITYHIITYCIISYCIILLYFNIFLYYNHHHQVTQYEKISILLLFNINIELQYKIQFEYCNVLHNIISYYITLLYIV